MLPQIYFLIGPKSGGKSTLGNALGERTNMKLLNFPKFVRDNGLKGRDSQIITMELIRSLQNEIHPRVMIEDFPEDEMQAKFFFKNCTTPLHIFYVKCSKDTC